MRDLGRGIRDTEVAGSLWVRKSEEWGIYCLGQLALMKNNCHAAQGEGWPGVRKMAKETNKTDREEESGRERESGRGWWCIY